MKKSITEDYFNFCISRAECNGKYDFLKDLTDLVKNGMPVESAISYLSKKLANEANSLRKLEKYYEG